MGTWLKRKSASKKYVLSHDNESMDRILEGLLESKQPDGVKLALIERICEASNSSHPAATIRGVLEVSSKWVLHGTTKLEVSSGFKLLKEWGCNHLEQFGSFFTPNLVSGMLQSGIGMDANVPLLIREGFRVMRSSCQSLSSHEHALIVQDGIIPFLCRSRARIVLRNTTLLLDEFNICIPASADGVTQLCSALLNGLVSETPPQDGKETIRYITLTDEIAGFLHKLWRLPYGNVIVDSLSEIFKIISEKSLSESKDAEPTISLASVVKHIPLDLANKVVKDVVNDSSIYDNTLEVAICNIVDWLKWPTACNVAQWILRFLTELGTAGKYSLLIRITENNTEMVVENLMYPQLREQSFNVLYQMLMSFQHSPAPFHKALEKVPAIWASLKKEGTPQSHAYASKLATMIHCLMFQHTGFPDVYDPILDLIRYYPCPTPEEIKIRIKATQWSSQVSTCVVNTDSSGTAPIQMASSLRPEKLEMGKTGLDNLGNTCYMNSVIQALYMCDEFCKGILSRPPSSSEGLLVKLQHVFASLSQSIRPSIAPDKFLSSSRPPWFTPGHQQDCSEFLKYLLDQLHENEKSSRLNKSSSLTSLSSYGSLKPTNGSYGRADLKDGVLLTSIKMKNDDECSASDTSSVSDKEIENPSLVEKTFRGKVQTTFQCLSCKTQSKRLETFSDIPLAFPNGASKSMNMPQKILGGGGEVQSSKQEKLQPDTPSAAPTTTTTTTATNTTADSETNNESPMLSVNDLINFYLKPERLSGDNQYHCDTCGKLQDGERQIHIVESPQYLILTLLRFSYDTKLQTHTKICQDVCYPLTLSVPVVELPSTPSTSRQSSVSGYHSRSNSLNATTLKNSKQEETIETILSLAREKHQSRMAESRHSHCELYSLCGVVIHSGTSSECGHYYCYSRHSPSGLADAKTLEEVQNQREKIDLDQLDLLPDQWYNFNDGRVSNSAYNSFSNVTKRFSKDTAYVLIYRKLDLLGLSVNLSSEQPLRPDLREAILIDNDKYMQEQEREARFRAEHRRRSVSVTSANLSTWKNDDDDDDKSGGGGHCGDSMGGGLDTSGSRFVF